MSRKAGLRDNMPSVVVVALGGLMTLAGCYGVYFGNTYISIERGWSAFISGTVLLTGGLVTVALGFAIHAITGLKQAVLGQYAGLAESEIAPAYSERDFVDSAATLQPVSSRLEPGIPDLGAALPPQAVPDLAHDASEPILAAGSEHGFDAQAHDHGTPTGPVVPAITAAGPSHGRDLPLGENEPASRADAELAPAAISPPAARGWRDRSLAELGRDLRAAREQKRPLVQEMEDMSPPHLAPAPLAATAVETTVPAAAPAAAPMSEPHDAPDLSYAHAHQDAHAPDHEPSTQTATIHDEEAPPTAPTSPVIGRYDAEGTSYVMYADGSIEAQSEAGVYRFTSMAELKGFIEG